MTPTTDDEVLRLLGEQLRRADPVPGRVVAAAKAASTWRTIDAELAELVFDSAVDSPLTAVRGAVGSEGVPRLLSFQTASVTIEIELMADESRLSGQLIPAVPARVELVDQSGQSRTSHVDDLGRFHFDTVQRGPITLVCTATGPGDAWSVRTAWVAG